MNAVGERIPNDKAGSLKASKNKKRKYEKMIFKCVLGKGVPPPQ